MSAIIENVAAGKGSHFGHDACVMCGESNPWSLNLGFEPDGVGGVHASFKSNWRLQGYDGLVHGGVIAALLDSAMTHCLFHRGIRAVTGDLRIRYPHPVPIDRALTLRAWVAKVSSPIYRLQSELIEQTRVLAWAQATFCETGGAPVEDT